MYSKDTSSAVLDLGQLATLLSCSERHIRRLADEGALPQPVKVGSLQRWRLRTGDPNTGILDWLEAGCPRPSHSSFSRVEGHSDGK